MLRIERECGVPSLLLMENAGRSVAEIAIQEKPRARRALVVCGAGNNGGDGFVAARHLVVRGLRVQIFFYGSISKAKPDAALNAKIARKVKLSVRRNPPLTLLASAVRRADLVIDALFGTGISRTLSKRHRRIIECLNAAGNKTVSIDLPSGMDADTGGAWGAVTRPFLVISLGRHKKGVVAAATHGGFKIRLADISLPL